MQRGRIYERCVVAITLRTSLEAFQSMVDTDEGRVWGAKSNRGADLNCAMYRYNFFNRNPP
jgi:hypothetical protein